MANDSGLFVDPSLWVVEEGNEKGAAIHRKERELRGFSRYDWYNFDSYLRWVIANVNFDVVQGRIKVENSDVVEKAEEVHTLLAKSSAGIMYDSDELTPDAMDPEVLAEIPEEEREDSIDFSLASERVGHQYSSQAIRLFFDSVFPFLPRSDDRYYFLPLTSGVERERASRGYSEVDLCEIRSYLGNIIIHGLQMFASPMGHGYSGESPEAWEAELHAMSKGFMHLQVAGDANSVFDPTPDSDWFLQRKAEYEKGMNLFVTRFNALWD